MGLDMSIVFKLTSLDDLKNLANALDETVTFQAKIQLEEEIKRLSKRKNKLTVEIEALRMRSGHSKENDVQMALNGLYGYLILRLQKKEISSETKEAFGKIGEWMARLAEEWNKTGSR